MFLPLLVKASLTFQDIGLVVKITAFTIKWRLGMTLPQENTLIWESTITSKNEKQQLKKAS